MNCADLWAHPRVRGEHAATHDAQVLADGSSPRARGALRRVLPPARRVRLIPACAGSTPRPRSTR